MKITPPKNNIHRDKRILCGLCQCSASNASNGVMIAQNKNECVKPRCANKLEEVSIQKEATKSISGTLCAMAPHSIAFLPSVLPAKASPMQAPRARCVKESIYAEPRAGFFSGCMFNASLISSIISICSFCISNNVFICSVISKSILPCKFLTSISDFRFII